MMPEIKINTQLVIEPKTPEYPGRYLSRVEDSDMNYIYISVPLSKQHFIPIRVGTVLGVFFAEDSKSYYFQTTVVDRKTDPFPVLVIAKPEAFEQRERRKFIRCKAALPVTVKINSPEVRKNLGFPDAMKTFTSDISLGGLLFDSHIPLPFGLILQIEIQLPFAEVPELVLARIIRTIDEENGKYGIAVKFVVANEKTRNEIIKFIFDVERERRGL